MCACMHICVYSVGGVLHAGDQAGAARAGGLPCLPLLHLHRMDDPAAVDVDTAYNYEQRLNNAV